MRSTFKYATITNDSCCSPSLPINTLSRPIQFGTDRRFQCALEAMTFPCKPPNSNCLVRTNETPAHCFDFLKASVAAETVHAIVCFLGRRAHETSFLKALPMIQRVKNELAVPHPVAHLLRCGVTSHPRFRALNTQLWALLSTPTYSTPLNTPLPNTSQLTLSALCGVLRNHLTTT